MMRSPSSSRVFWSSIATAMVMLLTQVVSAADDLRELRAREAFAAGRYQDALDIFAKLYAETLHPTYLRNVGRCYQNLGEPDKAISSFQEYLRKGKDLTPAAREEIQRYIREMNALKAEQREGAGEARLPPSPSTPQEASPSDLSPQSAAVSAAVLKAPAPGSSVLIGTAPPPPTATPRPIYRRWWFWTALGAAAAAGAAVFVLTRSTDDPPCTLPDGCL